ncbi:MAG: nucleotide exchange factor GrpE [bacterium]|nr:nucleotide exchange factor GrpE [bacterium]
MDDQNNNQQEESKDKLSLTEKERDEYLDGWKRAKAELINAKKEWEGQSKDIASYAKMDFIKQMLPILDALEAAKETEGWQEIKRLIEDIFKKNGVTEIDAEGKEFDPAYHEAILEGEGQTGYVIEVLQKGYKISDLIIRATKVKIGKQNI